LQAKNTGWAGIAAQPAFFAGKTPLGHPNTFLYQYSIKKEFFVGAQFIAPFKGSMNRAPTVDSP
jgi:hypothetical protein